MSTVLVWAGIGVAVLSAIRLVLTRDPFARLHFIGPTTVLAAPLVVAGLALRPWSSWHDVVKLILIGVLLVGTGPAAVVATARARKGPDG
ncbi:MAG: monovalent cation/H(+) antiporter subunit G [Actinoallomurus sp.]